MTINDEELDKTYGDCARKLTPFWRRLVRSIRKIEAVCFTGAIIFFLDVSECNKYLNVLSHFSLCSSYSKTHLMTSERTIIRIAYERNEAFDQRELDRINVILLANRLEIDILYRQQPQ